MSFITDWTGHAISRLQPTDSYQENENYISKRKTGVSCCVLEESNNSSRKIVRLYFNLLHQVSLNNENIYIVNPKTYFIIVMLNSRLSQHPSVV